MTLRPFQGLRPGTGITFTDNGDETATVDASAAGIPTDGWVAAGLTWTYASGSGGGLATFTVSGDLTATFKPGVRIKLTQTTVKYFVVTTSSYAAGTTTVSITAGSDYTLANAAITSPYFSSCISPEGYPSWFNYAVAASGFSGTPSVTGRFQVHNGFCSIYVTIDGTSNSTSFGFSLPVAVCAQGGPPLIANGYDNNATLLAPIMAQLAGSSTAVALRKTWMAATTSWTGSAGKGAYITCTYAI